LAFAFAYGSLSGGHMNPAVNNIDGVYDEFAFA